MIPGEYYRKTVSLSHDASVEITWVENFLPAFWPLHWERAAILYILLNLGQEMHFCIPRKSLEDFFFFFNFHLYVRRIFVLCLSALWSYFPIKGKNISRGIKLLTLVPYPQDTLKYVKVQFLMSRHYLVVSSWILYKTSVRPARLIILEDRIFLLAPEH